MRICIGKGTGLGVTCGCLYPLGNTIPIWNCLLDSGECLNLDISTIPNILFVELEHLWMISNSDIMSVAFTVQLNIVTGSHKFWTIVLCFTFYPSPLKGCFILNICVTGSHHWLKKDLNQWNEGNCGQCVWKKEDFNELHYLKSCRST